MYCGYILLDISGGDVMMKPLITVLEDRIKYDYENNILKAVQSVGIDVDKERLAKALIDSRSFYDEGYADAKAKYENALDKACRELNKISNTFERRFITTTEYWKEWCLDENR